jgi:hypothetical protein
MDSILLKSIFYPIKIEARYDRESISIQFQLFIIHSYTLSALHFNQKTAVMGRVWREMMPKGTAIIFDE